MTSSASKMILTCASSTPATHHAVHNAPSSVQHATCNMQRATCSVQHAACNMQHAACNMQHAACNMQHAACNMQCDMQHAARNMQCDMQHTACNMQCYMQHAPAEYPDENGDCGKAHLRCILYVVCCILYMVCCMLDCILHVASGPTVEGPIDRADRAVERHVVRNPREAFEHLARFDERLHRLQRSAERPCNKQHTTYSIQHATYNMQHTTCSIQH